MLDSGAIYRITALASINRSVDLYDIAEVADIAKSLDVIFVPDQDGVTVMLEGVDVTRDIRQESVGMCASIIAAHPAVREALLERQRAFQRGKGLIADGRDMGTTVFPDAVVKIFLTATAEERADRRYKQLIDKGESANLRDLLEDIKERDARDTSRSVSPLKPAEDAITIDSTTMSIESVLSEVLSLANQRI